ncbi:major facilitator superfamily domain-containing protein [Mariannaea sp. PMI_226]|nr:major facilitator superfamily domain-containing protein [Mariannaea sp. PMI_226]
MADQDRVLRKIDRAIIPLLFLTYVLNFMDKTILSSAAVFGLRNDNNLHGQQYSWVISIFYVGYLIWTYPTTLLIARLPTGKYLSANTLFWGIVVALTATCYNFAGLLVVRFLLGVAEATITPGFMFLTSTWYTRDEMPARVGMWFAGNSIGGLVASLFAFGIGHLDESHAWRWMYAILGAVTFFWAIPMFLFLPDSISKARFLTAEEAVIAADRVLTAGTGTTDNASWKWDQVSECLVDPKTWLIFGIEILTQIPNGGSQSFANIVVKSFGFTSLQSTLINIPVSLLSMAFISGSGYLAGKYRTLNCILIIAVILPCVIGSAIMYNRSKVSQGVQLMAYFFLSSGPAAMPLNMSLVQSNYRGVTKKLTMTALLFLAYCGGNIVGPHFFRKSEDPRYDTAFKAIMISYSLATACALILRLHLQQVNWKRVQEEGVRGSAGSAGFASRGTAAADSLRSGRDEDLTDWKMIGFRYRL